MQSQCFKLKDEICKFLPSGSKICGSWLPIPYIYVMKNDNWKTQLKKFPPSLLLHSDYSCTFKSLFHALNLALKLLNNINIFKKAKKNKKITNKLKAAPGCCVNVPGRRCSWQQSRPQDSWSSPEDGVHFIKRTVIYTSHRLLTKGKLNNNTLHMQEKTISWCKMMTN